MAGMISLYTTIISLVLAVCISGFIMRHDFQYQHEMDHWNPTTCFIKHVEPTVDSNNHRGLKLMVLYNITLTNSNSNLNSSQNQLLESSMNVCFSTNYPIKQRCFDFYHVGYATLCVYNPEKPMEVSSYADLSRSLLDNLSFSVAFCTTLPIVFSLIPLWELWRMVFHMVVMFVALIIAPLYRFGRIRTAPRVVQYMPLSLRFLVGRILGTRSLMSIRSASNFHDENVLRASLPTEWAADDDECITENNKNSRLHGKCSTQRYIAPSIIRTFSNNEWNHTIDKYDECDGNGNGNGNGDEASLSMIKTTTTSTDRSTVIEKLVWADQTTHHRDSCYMSFSLTAFIVLEATLMIVSLVDGYLYGLESNDDFLAWIVSLIIYSVILMLLIARMIVASTADSIVILTTHRVIHVAVWKSSDNENALFVVPYYVQEVPLKGRITPTGLLRISVMQCYQSMQVPRDLRFLNELSRLTDLMADQHSNHNNNNSDDDNDDNDDNDLQLYD